MAYWIVKSINNGRLLGSTQGEVLVTTLLVFEQQTERLTAGKIQQTKTSAIIQFPVVAYLDLMKEK